MERADGVKSAHGGESGRRSSMRRFRNVAESPASITGNQALLRPGTTVALWCLGEQVRAVPSVEKGVRGAVGCCSVLLGRRPSDYHLVFARSIELPCAWPSRSSQTSCSSEERHPQALHAHERAPRQDGRLAEATALQPFLSDPQT